MQPFHDAVTRLGDFGQTLARLTQCVGAGGGSIGGKQEFCACYREVGGSKDSAGFVVQIASEAAAGAFIGLADLRGEIAKSGTQAVSFAVAFQLRVDQSGER
ncbi:hypothetical protein BURKHO8Y_240184 [Burkholderia sp. 8Y]|nr:hypothetical protein BURKHO8Y_240184 [Burkholderia sp. 8Y]